jgi:hypothetical protein
VRGVVWSCEAPRVTWSVRWMVLGTQNNHYGQTSLAALPTERLWERRMAQAVSRRIRDLWWTSWQWHRFLKQTVSFYHCYILVPSPMADVTVSV